ncbi:MAG: phosphatase PAP2 family protein [Prolixibacteraceae bacterium]|nr:phosphatase PAP2 family protein [Prolixibacteraceae bacterium]
MVLIILLMLVRPVSGWERDSALVRMVIVHGLNDSKALITSPARWSKAEWALAGGVTAATGAMILWGDQPVYNFSNKLHTPGLDAFFRYSEPLGNYYPVGLIAVMLTKGIISKDQMSTETAFIAAEALLISTVAVQMVKNTVGRSRPNPAGSTTPHQFNGPFFKGTSFYSGHTTAAFSVASVFAYRYRHTGWVPWVSYGLATIAGLERIYDNRHWASDVVMGVAIGTATGLLLSRQWEESTIRFYPSFTPQGGGVSMVIPIR